jgi:hypothetical protein
MPTEITFKDDEGFRPVCSFFELYGEWITDGETVNSPITPEVLSAFGLTVHDLLWRVEVANLKPFHYTMQPGDRIAASIELTEDRSERQLLLATSPPDSERPLIPAGQHLPLGSVQLTKPTERFPELRLRFTPAAGWVYGPTNLGERSQEFVLPPDRLILNPEAAWCRLLARSTRCHLLASASLSSR